MTLIKFIGEARALVPSTHAKCQGICRDGEIGRVFIKTAEGKVILAAPRNDEDELHTIADCGFNKNRSPIKIESVVG